MRDFLLVARRLDGTVPLFPVYYFARYITVFLQSHYRCVAALGSVTGGGRGMRKSSFLLVYHNRARGVLPAWAAEADMMAQMGWGVWGAFV